jgi:translin
MRVTTTMNPDDVALSGVIDGVREALTARNEARDEALSRSRELIRGCSRSIRAVHRRDWTASAALLDEVRAGAAALTAVTEDHPDLYHAGYTQDALKEVAEAFITYALIREEPLPSPSSLNVEPHTYLRGLAEAATELRRFILDTMRRDPDDNAEVERLLGWMDLIYDELVTIDFPDAITGGLRRQTDIVRGVLERTRGDLTSSLREQRLRAALSRVEGLLAEQ